MQELKQSQEQVALLESKNESSSHQLSLAQQELDKLQSSAADMQTQLQQQAASGNKVPTVEGTDQPEKEATTLQAELQDLEAKLRSAEDTNSELQTQLSAAQKQHSAQHATLSEEVTSLRQELRSRASTPDSAHEELQQQLDSAKADGAKQASKLAQAEMRASLVRQQLQVTSTLYTSFIKYVRLN